MERNAMPSVGNGGCLQGGWSTWESWFGLWGRAGAYVLKDKGRKEKLSAVEHGLCPEKKRWKFPVVRKEETGFGSLGSHGI